MSEGFPGPKSTIYRGNRPQILLREEETSDRTKLILPIFQRFKVKFVIESSYHLLNMADIGPKTNGSASDLTFDNQPLWFRPERFLAPEFNAQNYIDDLKRYVRFKGQHHLPNQTNISSQPEPDLLRPSLSPRSLSTLSVQNYSPT